MEEKTEERQAQSGEGQLDHREPGTSICVRTIKWGEVLQAQELSKMTGNKEGKPTVINRLHPNESGLKYGQGTKITDYCLGEKLG